MPLHLCSVSVTAKPVTRCWAEASSGTILQASLSSLCARFDVAVAAAPLEVAYHPPDAGSLAAGLALVAARARYAGRLLPNRPAPGAVSPCASAIARKREAARTTTATLLTDVAADDLRLAFGGGGGPAAGSPVQVGRLLCIFARAPLMSYLQMAGKVCLQQPWLGLLHRHGA